MVIKRRICIEYNVIGMWYMDGVHAHPHARTHARTQAHAHIDCVSIMRV